MNRRRPGTTGPALAGRTVLVVEDRYFIARDICRAVRALGGEAVGPFGDLASAQGSVERMDLDLDLALVDINLRGETAAPLLRRLTSRGIPFILATGYEDWVLPRELRGAPRVEKPVGVRELQRAIERLWQ